MKWVTRENANVDRVACPWLINRFIDPQAQFLFVERDEVLYVAEHGGQELLRRSRREVHPPRREVFLRRAR